MQTSKNKNHEVSEHENSDEKPPPALVHHPSVKLLLPVQLPRRLPAHFTGQKHSRQRRPSRPLLSGQVVIGRHGGIAAIGDCALGGVRGQPAAAAIGRSESLARVLGLETTRLQSLLNGQQEEANLTAREKKSLYNNRGEVS
jgi:hypothetical protein